MDPRELDLIDISEAGTPASEPASAAERARVLAPWLKALADENRLTLVLLLAERPRTVRELTEVSGMSQTLVSHHLAPLRREGVVTVTPQGRSNIYALCCEAFAAPVRLLAGLADMTPQTDSRDSADAPAGVVAPTLSART